MSKVVSFEDVETVMDRMMQVPVLGLLEKCDISREHNYRSLLDPNLIMDVRHSILRKSLTNCVLKPQLRNGLTENEANANRKAREDHLFQLELRRFEKALHDSRPKFHPYKACKRNVIASSNDDNFWNGAIPDTTDLCKSKFENVTKKNLSGTDDYDNLLENENTRFTANIKVTIKDKPSVSEAEDEEEEVESILGKAFQILKENAKEKKRLRNLKLKVQQHLANKLLKRCLKAWKNYSQNARKVLLKKKEESEMTHERKIDIFVNAIAKKQEELSRLQKATKKDPRIKSAPEVPAWPTILMKQVCVVESPAQNRLKVQQKIIEEQKMKLVKQRQIIEEMQLKEFQNETRRVSKETLETAKEVLDYCGPAVRRTIIQLMKEKGYSDKSLDKPVQVPSPPAFLIRMEARAEARKERVKKAKEAREERLEEEKQKEEMTRQKEEEERKELQLEAQREAKRIRKEQERQKLLKLERRRILIEKADQFYQNYLLRRFIIDPFKKLLEIKQNHHARAKEHYDRTLIKRSFYALKLFSKIQLDTKIKLAISFYNSNLLNQTFINWKKFVLEEKQNFQVACDFRDVNLQIKTLNFWKLHVIETRAINHEKERIATAHYEKQLLITSFERWKRYLAIAEELRESDRRKEELRALVQKVIPDFDPRQRGVVIDD